MERCKKQFKLRFYFPYVRFFTQKRQTRPVASTSVAIWASTTRSSWSRTRNGRQGGTAAENIVYIETSLQISDGCKDGTVVQFNGFYGKNTANEDNLALSPALRPVTMKDFGIKSRKRSLGFPMTSSPSDYVKGAYAKTVCTVCSFCNRSTVNSLTCTSFTFFFSCATLFSPVRPAAVLLSRLAPWT